MFILGIETTCDETGVSLIEINKKEKIKILKNELRSQYKIHQKYGGVVPILAAREHKKNLPFLLNKIKKFFDLKKIEFIAFSVGPGLLPALVEGKEFVQNLAKKLNKKILPVDHLMAHFHSVVIKNSNKWQKIENIPFPTLVLIVSGGHTNLYLFKNFINNKKLGETLDDAAGEVLDKCARYINLPYPGGPQIEKMAKKAKTYYPLPKPLLEKGFNFSFSGLKTAFIELVDEIKKYKDINEEIPNLCFSIQKTIVDILIFKLIKAQKYFNINSFVISGGVSANQYLRKMILKNFPQSQIYFPDKELSTDNGLNIAISGYLLYKYGIKPINYKQIEVYPRS